MAFSGRERGQRCEGSANVVTKTRASRGRSWRSPAVPQPVAFNHRKHTQDLQLNCEFCHQYVTSGAHAGLPGTDICSTCHLAPLGESQEAARLTELLSQGDR